MYNRLWNRWIVIQHYHKAACHCKPSFAGQPPHCRRPACSTDTECPSGQACLRAYALLIRTNLMINNDLTQLKEVTQLVLISVIRTKSMVSSSSLGSIIITHALRAKREVLLLLMFSAKCRDPCPSASCGPHASCSVVGHQAVCRCQQYNTVQHSTVEYSTVEELYVIIY